MAEASTLPDDVLREPVSRDWPLVYLELLARCPEAEDRQGTDDLAALETSQDRYISGRKLRYTRWRPLCFEAPGVAELMEQSPEGTEERWAPYAEV